MDDSIREGLSRRRLAAHYEGPGGIFSCATSRGIATPASGAYAGQAAGHGAGTTRSDYHGGTGQCARAERHMPSGPWEEHKPDDYRHNGYGCDEMDAVLGLPLFLS